MLNQCSAVCVSNCRQKKEKLSPPFEKILGGNVKGTDVAAAILKGLGKFKMGKIGESGGFELGSFCIKR